MKHVEVPHYNHFDTTGWNIIKLRAHLFCIIVSSLYFYISIFLYIMPMGHKAWYTEITVILQLLCDVPWLIISAHMLNASKFVMSGINCTARLLSLAYIADLPPILLTLVLTPDWSDDDSYVSMIHIKVGLDYKISVIISSNLSCNNLELKFKKVKCSSGKLHGDWFSDFKMSAL